MAERRTAFRGLSIMRGLCHNSRGATPSNEERIMKKLTLSALVIIASSAAVSGCTGAGRRGRQDLIQQMPGLSCDRGRRQEQGRTGAQRARRPQVRHRGGLQLLRCQQEFRHHLERGSVQGIHQGSEGQGSRYQDGLRRHQEREGDQRSLGVRLAIRQGRKNQVSGLNGCGTTPLSAPTRAPSRMLAVWLVRCRSRSVRGQADHGVDLAHHKVGHGVLHHVTEARQHDQFCVRHRCGERARMDMCGHGLVDVT